MLVPIAIEETKLNGPERSVWFSDEMTPGVDWQWSGQHLFTSVAIRLQCWRNCLCDRPFDNKTWADPALGMRRRLESHSMVEKRYSAYPISPGVINGFKWTGHQRKSALAGN